MSGSADRIGSSREWAETNAQRWLQQRGFADIGPCPPTERPAASLKGTDVLARVAFSSARVGLDELKELDALAIATSRRHTFCFSVAGYEPDATDWADEVGMVLLSFTLEAKPANDPARRWLHPGPVPTVEVEHLEPGDRVTGDDGRVRAVRQVHVRKDGKLLRFVVSFDEGDDVELGMGSTVRLYRD